METAMKVYRSINNEAPNYLSSLFDRLSQNTIRDLPENEQNEGKTPEEMAGCGGE